MSASGLILVNSTTKASLILLAALAATTLLRGRSAALRHGLLVAALACAAATPVLERIVPAWDVRVARTQVAAVSPEQPASTVQGARSAAVRSWRADELLLAIWAAGVCISLVALALGLARTMRRASSSEPLACGAWRELADDMCRRYRLRGSVALLQSQHPTLLVTLGFLRPKIILPAGAGGWAHERMRMVLGHELAHVQRGDWLVQIGAELLRSAYWFNPLVWIACRRLRAESEQACDDAVLNLGVPGTEYAAQLMDLSRAFSTYNRTWPEASPAPEMARPSSLERRIRAMLNARLDRRPMTRSARVAVAIAFLSITVPIAGFGAAGATGPATFSGTLLDTFGRMLPEAPMVLTNAGTASKREVKSDQAGRFTFTGLLPGDYDLHAQVPGFATRYRVTLRADQILERDVTLQIGTIEETISVSDGQDGPLRTPPPVVDLPPFPEPGRCGQSPTGGCLEEPRKLRHVEPVYPPSRKDAATVRLEGRIGTDGFLKAMRLASPADAAFGNASLEAVSQWQFRPTRLNGVTVETEIKVTINFKAR